MQFSIKKDSLLKGCFFLYLLLFYLPNGNAQFFAGTTGNKVTEPEEVVSSQLQQWALAYNHLGDIKVDDFQVCDKSKQIRVFFSRDFTHIPLRKSNLMYLELKIREALEDYYTNYQVKLFARDRNVNDYIPNYYRTQNFDSTRIRKFLKQKPLRRKAQHEAFTSGLSANHIALWHSHGLYFDHERDRWQWQRARLFGTIEDLLPMDYVLKFLTPMLENAGAYVFIPRERDMQTQEVIVDISHSTKGSKLQIENGKTESWRIKEGGFGWQQTYYDGENPFEKGQHLSIQEDSGAFLKYIPNIPEAGKYAVYVSWAFDEEASHEVAYSVQYAGGEADFLVNQQMAYGTWVYLGTYYFEQGKNPDMGSLTVNGNTRGAVTSDAVRFGGGMGSIARRASKDARVNRQSADDTGNPEAADDSMNESVRFDGQARTSNMPRYTEAARYYLQYAGMPASLVYSHNDGANDYNDDFMSRGEWVNYLVGAPLGPEQDRDHPGLGVPVDVSISFHTDAGITASDSVIGTLAIYSAQKDEGVFPDGVSRLGSRDLADLIQTQVVDDIRNTLNPQWTRRGLWDRQYSEAWRPNVPSVLVELLSHQNLADMQYALDPHFQFITSRAVYKGIARFIARQENRKVVIQPLPPTHFKIEQTGKDEVRLSWKPQNDPLETSAKPSHYKVYTRKNQQGFDQGMLTTDTSLQVNLEKAGALYSFKVSALNSGGESFPSEILSASLHPDSKTDILLVNGFTRMDAPPMFDSGEWGGIMHWEESAIPYMASAVYTGQQYDYRRSSPWLDDDSPGWGGSYADMETHIVAGNSMDYPAIYGKQLAAMQHSFVSVSRASFEKDGFPVEDYQTIITIMGKQRQSPYNLSNPGNQHRVFNEPMIANLKRFLDMRGNLLISGAHLGTDITESNDSLAIAFARQYLGWSWRTNHADNVGEVVNDQDMHFAEKLTYNTLPGRAMYVVDAPDAFEPEGPHSRSLYRYRSNLTHAAIIFDNDHKAVSAGFPLESLKSEMELYNLLEDIIQFFENF